MTEYGWRYNNSGKDKRKRTNAEMEGKAQETLIARIQKAFRIYFPTQETVENSKGGASVCLLPSTV